MSEPVGGPSVRVTAVEVSGDRHRAVRVAGDIDMANVAQFEEAVTAACGSAPALTVDLTEVNYCDSAAVRALFALAARTKLTMVVSPAGQIATLLAISGLDRAATVVVEG